MKGYNSRSYIQSKNFDKLKNSLSTLGIELPETGISRIGITRKSHEESKKKKKMAKESRRINRRK